MQRTHQSGVHCLLGMLRKSVQSAPVPSGTSESMSPVLQPRDPCTCKRRRNNTFVKHDLLGNCRTVLGPTDFFGLQGNVRVEQSGHQSFEKDDSPHVTRLTACHPTLGWSGSSSNSFKDGIHNNGAAQLALCDMAQPRCTPQPQTSCCEWLTTSLSCWGIVLLVQLRRWCRNNKLFIVFLRELLSRFWAHSSDVKNGTRSITTKSNNHAHSRFLISRICMRKLQCFETAFQQILVCKLTVSHFEVQLCPRGCLSTFSLCVKQLLKSARECCTCLA